MPDPLIRLEAVTKLYQAGEVVVRALDRVTLAIQRGELVAIMGASGSGKSTLMNILGCLDRPSAGRYLLAGREVSRLGANDLAAIRNAAIGFVLQQFNLLPRTSAVENVELPLLYAGMGARERRRRAVSALTEVGLGSRMYNRPNQLSGGQQQRVAIARALVTRPLLVLADEPTGALDSRTSVEIMATLQGLWRSRITVVLVTHEPDIATYAERVLVVRDGRIVSDTRRTPREANNRATPPPGPALPLEPNARTTS